MNVAKYVQRPDTIDFIPNRNIDAGEIVKLGDLIGITKIAVPAGTIGALSIEGIFDVIKDQDASFLPGMNVYWDPESKTAKQTGIIIGMAIQNCTAEQSTVRILLNYFGTNEAGSSENTWQTLS